MRGRWEAMDDDDFIRNIGMTGVLRVEQMSRRNWWCAVYVGGEDIWNRTRYKTCQIAKQTAIRVYNNRNNG